MISVTNLAYQYRGAQKITFSDFRIEDASQWLLLGDSGSGKTTLLHLIGGLLKSQQGTIEVLGTDITKLSEAELDRYRGLHFGFVFQKNHLIRALTVKQNLLVAPFFGGLSQDMKVVDSVLNQLGLFEKRNSSIDRLSQGQAQRVGIARALLNRPAVIIADEPTSALDDKNCEKVIRLLLETTRQQYASLIVATHDQRVKSEITNQVLL